MFFKNQTIELILIICASSIFVLGVFKMCGAFKSNEVFESKIISPKPGIECVIVRTGDGASVDCWKINQKVN